MIEVVTTIKETGEDHEMEACASAHYWSRELEALGHQVRLIPPQYVKAHARGNKSDYNDALAIAEAVVRPEMRFVAVKTTAQQDQGRARLHQGSCRAGEQDGANRLGDIGPQDGLPGSMKGIVMPMGEI